MGRTEKFRGSRTHGAGKKAHRGAGKRGGKGNAGLHKHRFMEMNKYMPDHFGVHGFSRPQSVVARQITLNVCDLDKCIERLASEGKATLAGDTYEVDLDKLGFDKLVGKGKATRKMKAVVEAATPSAVSKIEAAGGTVVTGDQAGGEAPTAQETSE